MTIKTYNINGVEYGYSPIYKKWTFKVDAAPMLIQACNGKHTANKVANIYAGSIKRRGELDGLARANISRLTLG